MRASANLSATDKLNRYSGGKFVTDPKFIIKITELEQKSSKIRKKKLY